MAWAEREQQRQRASRLIWGRNPFEGPRVEQLTKPEVEVTVAPAGPTARALALTGISISGVERYAVIEQQVVQVGDALLGGYTVIELASGSVRLIRDDEELILALDEP